VSTAVFRIADWRSPPAGEPEPERGPLQPGLAARPVHLRPPARSLGGVPPRRGASQPSCIALPPSDLGPARRPGRCARPRLRQRRGLGTGTVRPRRRGPRCLPELRGPGTSRGSHDAGGPERGAAGNRERRRSGAARREPWDVDPFDTLDVPAALVAEDATIPEELVPLVRYKGQAHAAFEAWTQGREYAFNDPVWDGWGLPGTR
jgi:hypothetical protein